MKTAIHRRDSLQISATKTPIVHTCNDLVVDIFENEDENHEGHNIRSGGGGCFIQEMETKNKVAVDLIEPSMTK